MRLMLCFKRRILLTLFVAWLGVTIISYVCLKEEANYSSKTKHLRNFNHPTGSIDINGYNVHDPAQEEAPLTYKRLEGSRSPAGSKGHFHSILQSGLRDIDSDNGGSKNSKHPLRYEKEGRSMDFLERKAHERAMEYCNPPGKQLAGQEGDAPEGFTLLSVHVVIRHGDRSPMYKLPNQDSPNLSCILQSTESETYRHLIQSFFNKVKQEGHKIPSNQMFGLYPRQRTCMGAQLTGTGSLQHLITGDYLQEIYIKKHHLLSIPINHGDIYIRSTDYSRTFQSAVAFIQSFVPEVDFARVDMDITNNINFCHHDLSGVPCSCPVINRFKEFAKKEEMRMKSNETSHLMSTIKSEVGKIYGMNPQLVPWLGGIVEVLMGYICHNMPLPCVHNGNIRDRSSPRCLTLPLVGNMWQYLDARGAILLSGHADMKYSTLLMYPLLREIALRMINRTTGDSRTKFTLYSGHDLTITPLMKALGIHDGRWPPYASRLVLELYSSPSSQYFIRVLYNGNDKTRSLKFCNSRTYQGLCPLKYFINFVFQDIFQGFKTDTYTEICRI